ncbi:MAG: protein-glutamate O-methyltransferase CheR [Geobacteraceae bacterium]|nr:protein-glutamate O-methyltransferase CheR [Geobacteraceae bacterium]
MLFFTDSDIKMTDEEFVLLRDLIYNYSGLYFAEENRYLLERRLSPRLSHHQLVTFHDYYYYLKYDVSREQELSDIMDLLTTNETYFFRESFQLKAFTEEIIPELIAAKIKNGDKTLRIWSAGCSTGEEPYTIAILLLEMPALAGWKIEIIGTDISQRVLHHARKGVYGNSSFRVTEPHFKSRYFHEQDGGYRVNDRIREIVTFSRLNLYDSNKFLFLGKMDLIFCRNVIIYFDIMSKKRVIEHFYTTLHPGGFLLLGHSESLMNITTAFKLRHFKNDMVYEKPLLSGSVVK